MNLLCWRNTLSSAWSAISVAIVSIAEDMPQEPSNYPIVPVGTVLIDTSVIERFGLRAGKVVDINDFPVLGRL